ncbi:hypothetical protein Pan14r_41980 [Crateriforma conspicua]|uniref:Uncharacterized protein n=1 Tax=Crateriforma conspicua TaxID=2527996 RepID=A0A5C5YBS8_9PLAN|nr:hypothetical protein Mal65_09960 [Crateriforma conspicua]TWT71881.1 hypothetical protein Pan14r_41980 [Crateriforma conspicua]
MQKITSHRYVLGGPRSADAIIGQSRPTRWRHGAAKIVAAGWDGGNGCDVLPYRTRPGVLADVAPEQNAERTRETNTAWGGPNRHRSPRSAEVPQRERHPTCGGGTGAIARCLKCWRQGRVDRRLR